MWGGWGINPSYKGENPNITLESTLLTCISASVNWITSHCVVLQYVFIEKTSHINGPTQFKYIFIQCLTVQYMNNECRQNNFALPLNTIWPFNYNFPKSLFLHLHNFYLPYKVSKSWKSKNNVKFLWKTITKKLY